MCLLFPHFFFICAVNAHAVRCDGYHASVTINLLWYSNNNPFGAISAANEPLLEIKTVRSAPS